MYMHIDRLLLLDIKHITRGVYLRIVRSLDHGMPRSAFMVQPGWWILQPESLPLEGRRVSAVSHLQCKLSARLVADGSLNQDWSGADALQVLLSGFWLSSYKRWKK